MPLTKSTQQLRRDLKAISCGLKPPRDDLEQAEKTLSDSNEKSLMGIEVCAENVRNMRTAKATERNIAPTYDFLLRAP